MAVVVLGKQDRWAGPVTSAMSFTSSQPAGTAGITSRAIRLRKDQGKAGWTAVAPIDEQNRPAAFRLSCSQVSTERARALASTALISSADDPHAVR
jgi:hypothetical protein